jgi:hypothetical protein
MQDVKVTSKIYRKRHLTFKQNEPCNRQIVDYYLDCIFVCPTTGRAKVTRVDNVFGIHLYGFTNAIAGLRRAFRVHSRTTAARM